ncbi:hypothetical protein Prudu_270S000300, partial [Prunus dulcis]
TRIGDVTKEIWSKNREGQNGNLAKKSDFLSLSLLSPSLFSFFLSLLLRELGRAPVRLPGDGPATTSRADLRRRYHRVPSKPPELPAQNSPSFLHQIDRVRHQKPDRIAKETFEGSKRDSAEFSAAV